MTLPLNHSKDRARLIAEYYRALESDCYEDARVLRKAILEEEEFNTQSTDSGG